MGKTLGEVAEQLKEANKKVQLIYAFNGVGKTRLSREFKNLVAPILEDDEAENMTRSKILYYNAFTEDLFYWDNIIADSEPKLIIQDNSFVNWIIKEQGNEDKIIDKFQHFTDDKLMPIFDIENNQVTFSVARGDDESQPNIKISKGEESSFVWSIFHALIEQVIYELNIPEQNNRSTKYFNDLEYIFIDDPVSSLDENHLIELAVNLAYLIKSSESGIKFIITTHSPLFYNVLYNEVGSKLCYMLKAQEDGLFELEEKKGDSNKAFSYHLFLIQTIEEAVNQEKIQKYHFTLLRNLYEKTANFLGYPRWTELLPSDNRQGYYNRIIQFASHSTLSNETVAEPTEPEKKIVKFLLNHLIDNYNFWKRADTNDARD